LDLQQIFHIDHIFPKSRYTPTKLRESQLSEDEMIQFKDYSDRLPNLQLLQGHKNIQKGATMPADWLRQFKCESERVHYCDIHLLGQVPESISDFNSFYEARRKLVRERIVTLLIKRQAIE
ncbi:MAG: hypothetical protein OXF06_11865, partial [Bacteroidetes bacterium]|nr:hypothetical protein [Bacteroidota bacterium]